MITTTTQTTITCDKCGRELKPGETWFQVTQTAASGLVNGETSNLGPVHANIVQLCEDDYLAGCAVLDQLAPLAALPPPPPPIAAAPPAL